MADAADQGVAAYNARSEELRKQDTYNALSDVYGRGAGAVQNFFNEQEQKKATTAEANARAGYQNALTPGAAAAQASETGLREAQTSAVPSEIASREASTAQTQQTTAATKDQLQREAQFRALRRLETGVDPTTGAVSVHDFDQHVAANADALGLDPAHVGPLRDLLTGSGGAQHLSTIEQSLIAPTQVTGAPVIARDADNNSVILRADKYGNVQKTELGPGVTPVTQQRADIGAENAGTAQKRQVESARHNVADEGLGGQRNAIAARGEGVRENNSDFGAGPNAPAIPGSPAPKPAPAPGTAAAGAPAAPPGSPAKQPLFDTLPPKGQQMAIGEAGNIRSSKINLDNANKIVDSMDKQIGPFTVGAGALMRHLPAGVAVDLQRNSESLKAQAAQAVIQGMKNGKGQTGIGRVLQAEYANFTNMYGNLEQDQSVKQYKYHLSLLKASLNHMYELQNDRFEAFYGKKADDVLPQHKATSGGFTYLGVAKQ